MTMERVTQDVIELAEYACKQLNKSRLILIGHSWGGMLGLFVIKRKPELFHAFVGTEKVKNLIEFSQEETMLILSGTNFEALPPELAGKIKICGMKGYYLSLPRNLRAWFENVTC